MRSHVRGGIPCQQQRRGGWSSPSPHAAVAVQVAMLVTHSTPGTPARAGGQYCSPHGTLPLHRVVVRSPAERASRAPMPNHRLRWPLLLSGLLQIPPLTASAAVTAPPTAGA
ncbi:hypothetical protein Vretifemale_7469 [Volvox reticuliferus]|nr:hypothetical protein Vretifemale_7469 [Volvox reticuliferus]